MNLLHVNDKAGAYPPSYYAATKADLVMGRPPIVDPSPFRFSRFSDGSNPRPIAGL